jgi:hypothetical protein
VPAAVVAAGDSFSVDEERQELQKHSTALTQQLLMQFHVGDHAEIVSLSIRIDHHRHHHKYPAAAFVSMSMTKRTIPSLPVRKNKMLVVLRDL